MRTLLVRYCVACCVIGSVPAQSQTAQSDGGVKIEEIKAAWKARQDKLKSVHVEWVEEQFLPAGVLSHLWSVLEPRAAKRMNPTGATIPPRDTTLNIISELTVKDDVLLYKAERSDWHTKKGQFVSTPFRSLWDKKLHTMLHPNGAASLDWPTGFILKQPRHEESMGPHLRPLMATLRPLAAPFRAYPLEGYRPSDRTADIGGRRCVELRLKGSESSLWLDPEREYSVVREAVVVQGKVVQQITTDYTLHGTAGWLPSGWEVVTPVMKSKMVESYRVKIDRITIGPISQATFQLPFPPGTRVRDETRPRELRDYITKESGGNRFIHSSEIGKKSYHELLESDPPITSTAASGWWRVVIPAIAAVSVGFLVLGYRRWRFRKQSSCA